jgi:hypothetical protein
MINPSAKLVLGRVGGKCDEKFVYQPCFCLEKGSKDALLHIVSAVLPRQTEAAGSETRGGELANLFARPTGMVVNKLYHVRQP